MNILFSLLLIHSAMADTGVLKGVDNETFQLTNGVKCKAISEPAGDGCNTCTFERCTDGKEYWDEELKLCTLLYCIKPPVRHKGNGGIL